MNENTDYAAVKAAGTPYDSLIRQEADRQGISYDFMHKLIFNESSFDPGAESPTGPLGLGQFTKLTGQAYGLMSPEDRKDPQKAIPAVARAIKDLSATYKGDYLKTALAYNQGQGRLGSPQLAALDQGDLSKVSPEGQEYMRRLLDVSGDSASRRYFDAQGVTNPGIHPKADAVTFEDATRGVTAHSQVQVGSGLPDLGNMTIKGGKAPQTQQDYQTLSNIIGGNRAEKGTFEGTADAVSANIATSPVVSLARYWTQEDADPLDWVKPSDTSDWTKDDFEMIRREGVDPSFFSFVQDYAKGNRANLPNAIAMAKENQNYQRQIANAGTGAQIVGGFVGALEDPLSFVPIPGTTGARLISRVAQGALYTGAAAVASEGLRSEVTGIEGHYGTALVGGALFGAGATALFDRALRAAPKAAREELPDDQLESILARHGEASEKNLFDLHSMDDAFPNDFAPTSIRLEHRETARQLGQDDPTRLQWREGDEVRSAQGVDYVDHPSEPGAVRLQDGSILSADNPINPKLLEEAAQVMPDRAAQGVSMGGFTEIGYTLNRSENAAIREVGSQFFRPTTGTVSGSNGRFGATVSDIVERIQSQDHVTYNRLAEGIVEAIKDPQFALASGGRQANMEKAWRRIAEATEDQSGTKVAQLTDGEKKLMKVVNDHYSHKENLMDAPAQFGNRKARSILPATRHSGSYIPNVYSSAAKKLMLRRFGNAENLQEAIAESWLASYAARPHVRKRVDDLLKEEVDKAFAEATKKTPKGQAPNTQIRYDLLEAAVEDYAKRKAYGISHSSKFDSSSLISIGPDGAQGTSKNDFLEGRHLFDSDMEVPLGDGSRFSVNDLREFDLMKITPSYDRRVNGDIGIMGATGKTTAEMAAHIAGIKPTPGKTSEKAALEEAMKIVTGRARRAPEGAFGSLARSLSNYSFFSKNAYMGVQSILEVSGMVTKGHTRMLLKGVPLLKEMTGWGSKISPENLAEMHSLAFGRELDNHIRPSRMDIIERLRDQAEVTPAIAKAVGTIEFATQEASARSPFTKFLTESSNYIADAGRQGVLSDFVNHVLAGRESKLFQPQRLHSMSISPEQFKGMQDLITKHVQKQADGSYKIGDAKAFQADPRTMDLWRMGDKIADETILRPHKLSSADTEAYGSGVKMAMQFKNFTMRSVNSRLIRGYHDATKNGRAFDQVAQAVLSSGLALGGYMAMKYSQASGMPKDQREAFLKQALDPKMLGYAALSRSSHIGAPLGLANIVAAPLGFDQAAMVRSSILPRGPKESRDPGAMKYSATKDSRTTGVLGALAEQVPAYGVLSNVGQVSYNAFGAAGTDSRRADQEYMTGVFNGLRGLVPNDPVSQKLLLMMMESQGVEIR